MDYITTGKWSSHVEIAEHLWASRMHELRQQIIKE